MGFEWPTVKLGDYCKKIGSGATPRGGASVYMNEGTICLIRSQNIYNEGFRSSGLVYIDAEAANKLKNATAEENDVLLNITGDSVARVCIAKINFLPARVNQHVAIIRPHEKEFDPRFIRYLLASPAYQGILLSIAAVGATRNAITKGMIENLDVIKPPIKQQVKIADKLEALDDKIELNTQINQTLEQIAQALFKSWFVDFDPVKAKIAVLEAGGTAEAAELAAMSIIAAKALNNWLICSNLNPKPTNNSPKLPRSFRRPCRIQSWAKFRKGGIKEQLKISLSFPMNVNILAILISATTSLLKICKEIEVALLLPQVCLLQKCYLYLKRKIFSSLILDHISRKFGLLNLKVPVLLMY